MLNFLKFSTLIAFLFVGLIGLSAPMEAQASPPPPDEAVEITAVNLAQTAAYASLGLAATSNSSDGCWFGWFWIDVCPSDDGPVCRNSVDENDEPIECEDPGPNTSPELASKPFPIELGSYLQLEGVVIT